jgi:lambda repressor-like predicted transcriptional regulator
MTATLRIVEGAPDYSKWPIAAAGPDPAMVWARIDGWCTRRWHPRTIELIAEGPGEYVAPLQPVDVATTEVWSAAGEWDPIDLGFSPIGVWLPATGPYRLYGTAGSTEQPPAEVFEAVRRLGVYMAEQAGKPGASSESITLDDAFSRTYHRASEWLARAMVNSGAADLLRPYRRPR